MIEVLNNGYLESSNRKIISLGLKKSLVCLMLVFIVFIIFCVGVGRMGIFKYFVFIN